MQKQAFYANELTTEESALIKKIQALPCPSCHSQKRKLKGFETHQLLSAIYFFNHTCNHKILCSNCGLKEKSKAFLISLLMGWWSKKGLKSTPKILWEEIGSFFKLKSTSNHVFVKLIRDRKGYLQRKGSDDKTLYQLIKSNNVEPVIESR